MAARNASLRPELSFRVADARALQLPAASYDVVIDKGLLDAMLCTPNAREGVGAMLSAVAGALSPGGVFVLVSFGPPADRLKWVEPAARGWGCDIWTLPKPGMHIARGGEGGGGANEEDGNEEAPPPAVRYVAGAERDNRAHFVYLFTAAVRRGWC